MDHRKATESREAAHPARIPQTPARPTIPPRDRTQERKTMDLSFAHKSTVQGRVNLAVLEDGKVVKDHGWQSNLILTGGLDKLCLKNGAFWEELVAAHAGTGTTPTKVVLDGTFAQSGTTVTRSTGTGTFSAGDVGKKVKFATGEISKITAYTNSTTVTVSPSRTVSAAALTVYNVNQTGLATFSKGTSTLSSESGAQTTVFNSSTGEMLMRRTFIFSAESGSVNYTEVAVGSSSSHNTGVFARVLLDTPVTVGTGQQLRLTYEVTLNDSQAPGANARTLSITGWPYTYNISSITSTGSYFDVVFTAAHHYTTGAAVNLAGALPVKVAITGITSTVSDFTATTGAVHNLTTGQSVEIEDCTVTAYNGTWTVGSTPTTTTFTVTSAANPGAASDGTVRRSTPGTWYDGAWTVASVPNSTTIRVTSAINPIAAGASGTGYSNTDADVYHPTYGWVGVNENLSGSLYYGSRLFEGNQVRALIVREANKLTPSSFPWSYTSDPTGTVANSDTNSNITYVSGSGVRTNVVVWNLDAANFTDIRQIAMRFHNGSAGYRELNLLINFDELQRKDSGYELRLTITRTVEQVLN
jgi:hypothetical protein